MDLKNLMNGLSKSGALSGFMGGMAGGGLTSMVTSKKGRKIGGSALKVGALAAVGGLAWKAYQQYSAKSQEQQTQQQNLQQQAFGNSYGGDSEHHARQVPQNSSAKFDFTPAKIGQQKFEEIVNDDNPNGQMLLMRAMIAAAHSDGHIDDTEQKKIFAQVDSMDLSVAEKATLFDELRAPLTLLELTRQVPNAQTGIEVYAASATAVDLNEHASQEYLQSLAQQLCIPSELSASIQQQIQQY